MVFYFFNRQVNFDRMFESALDCLFLIDVEIVFEFTPKHCSFAFGLTPYWSRQTVSMYHWTPTVIENLGSGNSRTPPLI